MTGWSPEHKKRFNEPPDFFTANGMATGMALVAALEKTAVAARTPRC